MVKTSASNLFTLLATKNTKHHLRYSFWFYLSAFAALTVLTKNCCTKIFDFLQFSFQLETICFPTDIYFAILVSDSPASIQHIFLSFCSVVTDTDLRLVAIFTDY